MAEKKRCSHCSGTGSTSKYCCLKAVGAEDKYKGMCSPEVKCCACNGTGEANSGSNDW